MKKLKIFILDNINKFIILLKVIKSIIFKVNK